MTSVSYRSLSENVTPTMELLERSTEMARKMSTCNRSCLIAAGNIAKRQLFTECQVSFLCGWPTELHPQQSIEGAVYNVDNRPSHTMHQLIQTLYMGGCMQIAERTPMVGTIEWSQSARIVCIRPVRWAKWIALQSCECNRKLFPNCIILQIVGAGAAAAATAGTTVRITIVANHFIFYLKSMRSQAHGALLARVRWKFYHIHPVRCAQLFDFENHYSVELVRRTAVIR